MSDNDVTDSEMLLIQHGKIQHTNIQHRKYNTEKYNTHAQREVDLYFPEFQ